MVSFVVISWIAGLALAAGEPSTVTVTRPAEAPAQGKRYYVVEVKIIEVAPNGTQTVVAEPTLQTTGAAAGVTVEGETGRRFDFHFTAADAGAPAPLPVMLTSQPDEPKPIAGLGADSPANTLSKRVSITAVQQPRRDVIRAVAQQAGLRVAVEPDLAEQAVLQMSTPISVNLADASLDEALKQLVNPLNLGYSVRHDLVLLGALSTNIAPSTTPMPLPVARPDTPAEDWQVRVYGVSDLIATSPATGAADFQPLIQKLREQVTPKDWVESGGMATVRGFSSTGSLVIRQTTAGHAAVTRFLDQQRLSRQ